MSIIELKKDDEILEKILNSNELIVYEEIQGNKIFVNWNGKNWTFRPKGLTYPYLTKIDLTIQKYYIPVVEHFESLKEDVKNLLNPKWWFSFEYFPCNQPANILYEELPRNKLILTSICKFINKEKKIWSNNISELAEYSRLLKTDLQPFIFKGKLNDEQKKAIKEFLKTSPEDLKFLFGEDNFAYYFYKVLNPYLDSSFLMSSKKFNENLERIIIKSKDLEITASVLNPFYKKISQNNKTEHKKNVQRIIIDFIQNIQNLNLKEIVIVNDKRLDIIMEIICKLFNYWALLSAGTAFQWEIELPEYMTEERFKVNLPSIKDPITKDLLIELKNQYFFKIITGAIVGNIDLEDEYSSLNKYLENIRKEISKIVNKKLNIKKTKNTEEPIPFQTDLTGKVYPNISNKRNENGTILDTQELNIFSKKNNNQQ